MFHKFKSREERRAFGGSAFVELQFCRIKRGADISKIVSVNSIDHWQNDSLYIYIGNLYKPPSRQILYWFGHLLRYQTL